MKLRYFKKTNPDARLCVGLVRYLRSLLTQTLDPLGQDAQSTITVTDCYSTRQLHACVLQASQTYNHRQAMNNLTCNHDHHDDRSTRSNTDWSLLLHSIRSNILQQQMIIPNCNRSVTPSGASAGVTEQRAGILLLSA